MIFAIWIVVCDEVIISEGGHWFQFIFIGQSTRKYVILCKEINVKDHIIKCDHREKTKRHFIAIYFIGYQLDVILL